MKIKVTPNAKRDEVFLRDGLLCVKVSCPPEDGKANKRATQVLQKALGCKVMIVSGQKSREKEIQVGCGEEELSSKLKEVSENKK